MSDTVTIELRCPDCGSERIREWGTLDSACTVLSVHKDSNGRLRPALDDDNEVDWNGWHFEGYACAEYCQGRTFEDIEHFIVRD